MTLVNEFNSYFIAEEKQIINSLITESPFPDSKEDMIADLKYFSCFAVEDMQEFYDSLISKIEDFSDEKFSDLKRYIPLDVDVSEDDFDENVFLDTEN